MSGMPFFYVSQTSMGAAAQIGKTTFVRGGTSKESGGRDTTILHKYLLNQEKEKGKRESEFDHAIQYPRHIFGITDYFSSVEEAWERKEGKSSIWRELPADKGIEAETILNFFGIPENRLEDFLYAVLYAVGHWDGRLYIALPQWNFYGTAMALKLCERILFCLPSMLVPACGFLTYSASFHDSQINMIPRSVKLVFFPNNGENKRKYDRILQTNEIVDPSEGLLPEADFNVDTGLIIKKLKERFFSLEDNGMGYVVKGLKDLGMNIQAPFSPEALGCAYRFRLMRMNGGRASERNGELRKVIEAIVTCEAFDTDKMEQLVSSFLEGRITGMAEQLDEDSVYVLGLCHMYLSSFRKKVVLALCQGLQKSVRDVQKKRYVDNRKLIAKWKMMEDEVESQLYGNPIYYDAARYGELLFLEKFPGEDEKKFWKHLDILAEKYPDFLYQEELWHLMSKKAEQIFPDNISGKELTAWYEKGKKWLKIYEQSSENQKYGELLLKLVRQRLGEKNGRRMISMS